MKGFYTYDTSVIISRGLSDFPGGADRFLFSSIVLLELSASAKDDAQRKQIDKLYGEYAKDNSLIYPDLGDWQLASKILYWLTNKRRKAGRQARQTRAWGVSANGDGCSPSGQCEALGSDDSC